MKNIFAGYIDDEPEEKPKKKPVKKAVKVTEKKNKPNAKNTDRKKTEKSPTKKPEKKKPESIRKKNKHLPELPPPSDPQEETEGIPEFEWTGGNDDGAYAFDPKTGEAEEMGELIAKSAKAKLMQDINKEKIQKYEIEKKKLELEKAAGDVMEKEFGDFLFFGFMEKLYIDLNSMYKKLELVLDGPVKEGDLKEVIAILKKEVKAVQENVVRSQERDLEDWRREL